ncbi:Sec20-domain-containing protein [Flagelloscypha sp. PMI_526]|nr:Sec20-domain-containing protein [Flagelloscypha sp. PMI_526]
MAPIPLFSEDTNTAIDSARRKQKDLAEFQIPRLRDCKGPLSLQQEWYTEVRDDLEKLHLQVQDLDLLVDDQRNEKSRRAVQLVVEELSTALATLRQDAQAAVRASKKIIDSQNTSKRDELLHTVVTDSRSANEKTAEDMLMKKNEDLTGALKRMVDSMQKELETSVLSIQTLEDSTATMNRTSTTHDVLTAGLDTSKRLITALEKADWIDRMIIFFGLFVFCFTVLFILKQRIFDRGMRIAFWWTRFIPDFGGDEALLQMEEGVVSNITQVVGATASSIAAIASETLSSLLSPSPSSTFESPITEDSKSIIAELCNTIYLCHSLVSASF